MKTLTIIISCAAALSVSACAVTTAGIKKGDERNFARSVNDVTAGRAISTRMNRAYDFDLNKVDVEVAEGIAVLTGSVPTEKDKTEAERIAWSAPNVVQVGNEIRLNSKNNLVGDGKDAFLGTRIRSRLIAEKNVKARNVNIETSGGTVYLLGVARNTAELERITYIASTTKGVKDVVSYIKLADQPVTSQAGYRGAPAYSGTSTAQSIPRLPSPERSLPSVPRLPAPGLPQLPAPQTTQRELPGFLSSAPQELPGATPYFRDPVTGEQIVLPPGTKTVPLDPSGVASNLGPKVGDAPYYINPSNGEKVQIVWTGGN